MPRGPARVLLVYTNYRRKTDSRLVTPLRLRFGATPYYPEPQWLLDAFCWRARRPRTFAMDHVLGWHRTTQRQRPE